MPNYQPIEYTAAPDTFALLANTVEVQGNPDGSPRPRRSRKPQIILPGESYDSFQIKLAMIRPANYDPEAAPLLSDPQAVHRFLKSAISEVVELFLCIPLTVQLRVIGVYEVARGQLSGVHVTPVDVLRPVFIAGATQFVIAHNHPSSIVNPSTGDKALTDRIVSAAAVLGCHLLDHVILGSDRFYSFSQEGLL